LLLEDGRYTGHDSMIEPPDGLSGTTDRPADPMCSLNLIQIGPDGDKLICGRRNLLVKAIAVLAMVLTLVVSGFAADAQPKREKRRGPRDRSKMMHINEKGYPLNVNPEIAGVDNTPMADEDIVMGIVIQGEARAYPVNYMNGPRNEVVNDQLGGSSIAATW
jgi:hypothetical protein